MFRLLHVAVYHLHHIVLRGGVVIGLEVDDLSGVVGILHLLFHHTLAHGGHLGSTLGIDDSSHNVAAERRTDLEQKILVFLTVARVGMVADFERCAVRRQSAVKRRGDARSEISSYRSRSHERDARFLLLEEIDEQRCVRERGIGIEALVLEFV